MREVGQERGEGGQGGSPQEDPKKGASGLGDPPAPGKTLHRGMVPSTLDLGQETEPGEGRVVGVGVGVLLSTTRPRKHADTGSGGQAGGWPELDLRDNSGSRLGADPRWGLSKGGTPELTAPAESQQVLVAQE